MSRLRYSRMQRAHMTAEELKKSNDAYTAALLVAGFFTFGMTWVGLYFANKEPKPRKRIQ